MVATGDETEIGLSSEMIASAEVLATPLTRKIARFSHLLLYVILELVEVTFAVIGTEKRLQDRWSRG